MQVKTADQAIDMIQGHFYGRYNFYTDSCAISSSAFMFSLCLHGMKFVTCKYCTCVETIARDLRHTYSNIHLMCKCLELSCFTIILVVLSRTRFPVINRKETGWGTVELLLVYLFHCSFKMINFKSLWKLHNGLKSLCKSMCKLFKNIHLTLDWRPTPINYTQSTNSRKILYPRENIHVNNLIYE